MIIGLCGAHRSGKTTLGKAFTERHPHYQFYPTSTSRLMEQHGMDPMLDYPLSQRLEMQNIILDALDTSYGIPTKHAVFDRTPLDAAAYMLADVGRGNLTTAEQSGVCRYVDRCLDVVNRRFSMLLFIPAVLPLVSAAGKAPAELAYVEHIAQIINGLRCDERMRVKHFLLPRAYIELESRILALGLAATRLMANHTNDLNEAIASGLQPH